MGWEVEQTGPLELTAFTPESPESASERVTVRVKDVTVTLKSQCLERQVVDWGKNRRNLHHLLIEFKETAFAIGVVEMERKALTRISEWEASREEDETDDERSSPSRRELGSFSSLLIPRSGHWVTPLLIYIHLLIFTAMVISGVDAFSPSGESLLRWGANYKAITLNGEAWRLLTSVFIHSGLLPLLVNLFALLYIGTLLEPLLGRVALLTTYVVAGISGSVLSLWWHELSISAGAAGAIFGLYGVFIALLLLRNFLLKESSVVFLISTGIFLVFNLAFDLKDGIDNAAHAGGLISGFGIGLMLSVSLKDADYPMLRLANLLAVVFTFALVIYVAYRHVPDDIARYEGVMKVFKANEATALEIYRNPQHWGKHEWRRQLRDKAMKGWNENIQLLDGLDDLPEPLANRVNLLRHYCELQRTVFRMRINSINKNTAQYEEQIRNTKREIEDILMDLNENQARVL